MMAAAHVAGSADTRGTNFKMPWMESSFFEDILAARKLTDAQRALATAIHRGGHEVLDVGGPDFDALCARIVSELQGRYDHEGRATNAWKDSPAVRTLALNAQQTQAVRFLYDRAPIPDQTLNFDRGTRTGTSATSPRCPRATCAARGWRWRTSGCSATTSPSRAATSSTSTSWTVTAARGLEKKQIGLTRGQAVIRAANLFHDGSPILEKGSTRYSQVTHFIFEGRQYDAPLQSTVFDGCVQYLSFENIATGERVTSGPEGGAPASAAGLTMGATTGPTMAAAPGVPPPGLGNGLTVGLKTTSPAAFELLKRVTRPLRRP